MHFIDYSLIVLYLLGLLLAGFYRRLRSDSTTAELIVGGRMLTLPAFVASLVSTWYGGILGVGEYSYLYGISNWLVFGVPYYLAAFLFAVFLARRARESQVITIPERLAQAYDNKTAVVGSVIIYLMTVPAAYVLMLGVLCETLFGWPFWIGVVLGTLFSIVYLFLGGFRSVVRTDLLQFVLMFAGFGVLIAVLVSRFGGLGFLMGELPETHLTWHGGNSGWYIATWYVIALATLIEPAFFQRCYAAKNVRTARNGIFVSIIFWVLFDALTTSCGLYVRAVLPDLADPVASYPALARQVLPAGLLGVFALSLLASVMSTVDSYSFLAATTFSKDIVGRLKTLDDRKILLLTRAGLLFSAILAVVLAVFFRSVVDIWHAFGSIGTPALLVPVFFSFVGKRRLSPLGAFWVMIASGFLSLVWYSSQYFGESGDFWLGLQPIFPGLAVSLTLYLLLTRKGHVPLPEKQ
jgi:SSS family solute:Na+ symporter